MQLTRLILITGAIGWIHCTTYAYSSDPYPAPGAACSLSADQEGSIGWPVRNLPIRVVIDPAFSPHQRELFIKSADQWNQFAQASLGKVFFAIEPFRQVDYSRTPRGIEYCDTSTEREPGLLILRESSQSQWVKKINEPADANAVTRRCDAGNADRATEQLVVVNTAKASDERLPSVALHELGHVIGLGHSCAPNDAPGYRACDHLNLSHPYREAVMYPELQPDRIVNLGATQYEYFGSKETLQANDLKRAYCLYTGQTRLEILRKKIRDKNSAQTRE